MYVYAKVISGYIHVLNGVCIDKELMSFSDLGELRKCMFE